MSNKTNQVKFFKFFLSLIFLSSFYVQGQGLLPVSLDQENNTSILKPIVIDFANCSCVNNQGDSIYCQQSEYFLSYFKKGATAQSGNDQFYRDQIPSIVQINDEPLTYIFNHGSGYWLMEVSNNKVHAHELWDNHSCRESIFGNIQSKEYNLNGFCNFFEITLSYETICGGGGAGNEDWKAKVFLFLENDKYHLWPFEVKHSSEGSNQCKGTLFEHSSNSESRKIQWSEDILSISKWNLQSSSEGYIDECTESEINSIHGTTLQNGPHSEKDSLIYNKYKVMEYHKSKSDSLGENLVYGLEFPNFVRLD